MFTGLIIETMCPCGLHCIYILAHHRYLWKYIVSVIDKRKQEKLIPEALRTISCGNFSKSLLLLLTLRVKESNMMVVLHLK